MQFYFPAIHKEFIRTAQNSMCMEYFSADELTTAKSPKLKTRNNRPDFFLALHMFSSPEFGGWSIEQLSHPLYTQ